MIRAENLRLDYFRIFGGRRVRALDGFDLEVRRGEFVALIGENGAGKSSAMYCMLGLLRPTAGRVELLGGPPRPGSPQYRRIGYVPEEPHYHQYLTVLEGLDYYGSLVGRRPSRPRIDEILERYGLAEARDRTLSKCSKGMRQKFGLAQSLIAEPELLFLDEPTRGLDPLILRDVRQLLVDLRASGVTVVLNSHVLTEVEQLATRIAIVVRGRVARAGALAELTAAATEVYEAVAECPGEPPAEIAVDRRDGDVVSGTVAVGATTAFVAALAERGGRLGRLQLRRRSLEEVLVELARAGGADA